MTLDTPPSITPRVLAEPFAQVHETHTGVVLLYGDRAYKTKKPVVTDFLDFGTPAARTAACHRELELNRRLAPDVYLGIAELTDPLGGPSEPVLVMRRLPDDRRLAALAADGRVTDTELRSLAGILAAFHRRATRGPAIEREGTIPRTRHRWRTLFHSLAQQPPGALDHEKLLRAEHLAMRFLDGRGALFGSRITAGRIVDGHGDLLAEDIFLLPDGFRILDCLDFDDRLRYVDGLDDAAFLAMDLEFRGHPELATHFLDAYAAAAGDPAPTALRHHYIAYRAMVRTKTDRIRAAQHHPTAPADAVRHLDLALNHLEHTRTRLILIGGLPGTGKSTIATALAAATGTEVLSSDALRTDLRDQGQITGPSGHYAQGAYRPTARALVYQRLLEGARHRLEHGTSVILDASWLDPAQRSAATILARRTSSDLFILRCTAPPALTAARLAERSPGPSDATPEIAASLAADMPPWDDAELLDTTQPPARTLDTALTYIRESERRLMMDWTETRDSQP